AVADMTQEHPQKLDRRAIAAVAPLALYFWQGLGVPREAAFDRRQNPRAGARTLHSARKGAQIAQGLGRFRRGEHEFDQDIVLQNPRPWHVARLRLGLPPGGDLHENREIARFADPVAEPLPGVFG